MTLSLPQIGSLLAEAAAKLPGALAVLVGAFLVNLAVNRGLKLLADRTRLTHHHIGPFRRTLRWLIAVTAVILLLKVVFGVPLDSLWTAFTAVFALIAVGFIAVWSVLSNWLCTFVILLTHPFSVGDDIEFAGEPVKGRVVDLNFVFTTLRCEDGGVLQIPNNLFIQKVVKRHRGSSPISLVEQLNAREAADV
jgi:small-conductance mechanosensitive channel